jgi:hypothetical protein
MVKRRLVPAEDSLCAFNGCNCDKATETPMFKLRSLFYESPFILSVVGEHFCSEWSFTGAPRRNVGILFGHRRNATTKRDNGVEDKEGFRGKYAKSD